MVAFCLVLGSAFAEDSEGTCKANDPTCKGAAPTTESLVESFMQSNGISYHSGSTYVDKALEAAGINCEEYTNKTEDSMSGLSDCIPKSKHYNYAIERLHAIDYAGATKFITMAAWKCLQKDLGKQVVEKLPKLCLITDTNAYVNYEMIKKEKGITSECKKEGLEAMKQYGKEVQECFNKDLETDQRLDGTGGEDSWCIAFAGILTRCAHISENCARQQAPMAYFRQQEQAKQSVGLGGTVR